MFFFSITKLLTVCFFSGLVSCISLSDVDTPDLGVPLSSSYKNATSTAYGVKHNWWTSFHDSALNTLQNKLLTQNKDLAVALANYERTLGTLGITRAEKLPLITGDASVLRTRDSENSNFSSSENPYNSYGLNVQLGYEVDLWGRVRRLIKAGKADSEVAAATLSDVRLALQAQLARDYFALRFLDAEAAILGDSIKTRKEALKLANDRLETGLSNELDATRAQSLLASSQADLIALERPRAKLENVIAVLTGQNASQFRITPKSRTPSTLPSIPSGVPAGLLSRRPDIAAAEYQLIASSSRVGIAQVEPFPKLRLTGSGGLSSINTGSFLDSSSRLFTIGPSVEFPIFSGGRFQANLKKAKATQQADLATFQQTVLQALAEVESALTSVSALRREMTARKAVVTANRKSYELAKVRYDNGADTYLAVVDSQRELLFAERSVVRTRGLQYSATLQLIQALGGGFHRSSK